MSDAPLLHHDGEDSYDGIREHDNPAPPWLTRTFVACIVFAGAYFCWFQVLGKGSSPQQDFAVAWAEHETARKQIEATDVIAVDEPALARSAKDPDTLAYGQKVFAVRCVGCHTDNGRGLVGPNLTDEYQIHGRTRVDIYKTVLEGVAAKGMPAWGEQLPQHDVVAVTSFVSTLRGTNVAGGKAPQGDKVGPFTP